MPQYCGKLNLLMWKNYKIYIHQKLRTLLIIIIPVCMVLLLILFRLLVPVKVHKRDSSFPPYFVLPGEHKMRFESKDIHTYMHRSPNKTQEVVWCPKDDSSSSFTKECRDLFKTLEWTKVIMLEKSSESEMEKYMYEEESTSIYSTSSKYTMAAIVLEDGSGSIPPTVCSSNLRVKIRLPSQPRIIPETDAQKGWMLNRNFPFQPNVGPRDKKEISGPYPYYALEGFILIQSMLFKGVNDHCSTEKRSSKGVSIFDLRIQRNLGSVYMQRYSYPPHTEDDLIRNLAAFLILILVMAFMYIFTSTAKNFAFEGQTNMKEVMKIMGMPGFLHYVAWFVTTMILFTISAILVLILLKIKTSSGAVLNQCDASILLILLLLFGAALISLAFLVASFCRTANVATVVAAFIYIAFCYLATKDVTPVELPFYAIVLNSFSCVYAFSFGLIIIVQYEGTGEGIQWDTVSEPATPDDRMTMGIVWIMLVVDCILYFMIALYVDAIKPTEYGIRKKWNFLCKKSFWNQRGIGMKPSQPSGEHMHSENFEEEPISSIAGVKTEKLTKEYKKGRPVVDNLNINMYEGEITVLLGHNGAGKTTTMVMITGLVEPTSGKVWVSGYDMIAETEAARKTLGFCPQNNILWDDLTVREHLYFYIKLKELPTEEIEDEIEKFLKRLDLEHKENEKSRKLSGGMKRKLQSSIALCAGSKGVYEFFDSRKGFEKPVSESNAKRESERERALQVVLLDEPTAGLDPMSRRDLWNLLLQEKNNRTLIISTHFMDEADVLGDRIGVMSEGKLEAYGSSFFLKKRFGSGYHLVVVKGPNCREDKITKILSRHVRDLRPIDEDTSEITYELDQKDTKMFEALLKELEDQKKNLDIVSFGISFTKMEDVFMKVSRRRSIDQRRSSLLPSTSIRQSAPTGSQVLDKTSRNSKSPRSIRISSQAKPSGSVDEFSASQRKSRSSAEGRKSSSTTEEKTEKRRKD